MSDSIQVPKEEIKHKKLIIVLSIVIPLAVAALFAIKIPGVGPFHFLPKIYASINGLTAVSLIVAVIAIIKKKRKLHEFLMKSSMIMTSLFLVLYIIYHMTSDSTVFGDADHNGILSASEALEVGSLRLVYVLILLSHIVLSVAVLPIVLITYVRGISNAFTKHKKIARFAFPIWLYVAVTGVVVYLMIAPYYA